MTAGRDAPDPEFARAPEAFAAEAVKRRVLGVRGIIAPTRIAGAISP